MPGDIAVAGFDDAPVAVQIWPPLTTVRQDVEALAQRGVEMLVERHRKGSEAEGEAYRSERKRHEVIVWEST